MITDQYIRKASVRRVIDGDTLDVLFDDGRRHYSAERIRLLRINTPEVRGADREEGFLAKAFVEGVLPVGSDIFIQTHKADSFDRWLGEVWYTDEAGQQHNLNDQLLKEGYAVPYLK